ncbi:unnamed protein product [Phyllotreta striolata]|uniref:DHHA2 domain-containing protein n=1 Tax=Phyllotreta striolata TaxID=444603 RepID=A0A9N9TNT4_PHYSR|nr:unnamed protein product [Phyllotreta striolata]
MEEILIYLNYVKQSLRNIKNFTKVHIVLGNESCDIDSSVSSLVLAYFISKKISTNCFCPLAEGSLVIPVQNVTKEDFLCRTDNCYLYKEINLPLDLLIYKDELNMKELISSVNLTTTLVDHHVLSEDDKFLKDTVLQIFDHRPRDIGFDWPEDKVRVTIREVGSCSTLIADKILSMEEDALTKDLGFLIYAAIVFDTQALSPKSGRAKELDHYIVGKLEEKFQFSDDRKTLFDILWKAHNDISQLTPRQILIKDLKIVGNVAVPGLPMLVEDFLKLDKSYQQLKSFAEEFEAPVLVLVGLDAAEGNIKRDLAVLFKNESNDVKEKLLEMLINSQKYKGYDFQFKEVPCNYEDIKCYRQENVSLSRKQVIPIIKDFVNSI